MEGEHIQIRMAYLNHGVGEDLQELFYLEGRWLLMRLWELKLHRGIGFRGDERELGCHDRGVSG